MVLPDAELGDHSFRLCQDLLRIDTTNPPGLERAAADLVAGELADAGLEPVLLESAPSRANVVTRLKGTGELPPLLLAAHLDVVEADASKWVHPPFSGVVADGCLWGRGAVDMKNMAAMSAAVMCRLQREKVKLKRDLIFAAVADEEAACDHGSKWLVGNHPDLVRAEYALGECGGFSLHLGKTQFITVQVAEKGICWLRAKTRGEPGHGSMPRPDSAVIQLCSAIARLGETRLPTHMTGVVTDFLHAILAEQPKPLQPLLQGLFHPGILPHLLRLIPDPSVARGVLAMLSNTASPTILRAGRKINVIPGGAEAEIDGRMLPGQSVESFLSELRVILGPNVDLEVARAEPPTVLDPYESPLYSTIFSVLKEREPDAVIVPYLAPGFTDAMYFARLGIKWYGFSPVKLPRGLRFGDMYHGHNERVPIDGLRWGTDVLFDVVKRFAAA